ncbi:MAG: DUF1917 domain-containing protein [Nanoarchaeota archaeon]|nr:DUF1917 domain-containing protein [Nanoarchaeota archaeon]
MKKSDLFPSKIIDDYWVNAECKKKYPKPTKNSGKWLVFTYTKDLDKTWQKITKATEKGELGIAAKSATSKSNPNASNEDTRVICVYTYDSEDKNDVARIAWRLYELEINPRVLNYKKDNATFEGKYANKGHTKISRYSVSNHHFKNKTKDEFFKFFKERFQ